MRKDQRQCGRNKGKTEGIKKRNNGRGGSMERRNLELSNEIGPKEKTEILKEFMFVRSVVLVRWFLRSFVRSLVNLLIIWSIRFCLMDLLVRDVDLGGVR